MPAAALDAFEQHESNFEAAKPEIATDAAKLAEACANLSEAQSETERLYARWEELEAIANGT